MFKKIGIKGWLGLAVLSFVAGLYGYSDRDSRVATANSKPEIVASHSILCDLVNSIAEDTVDLTCLIDSNQDPHAYRPTPSQKKAMEQAQLILYGGYQLEPQIIQLIDATETSAPKLAIYEQTVAEPIQSEPHEHEDEHGHEHEHGHEDEHGHEHEHTDTEATKSNTEELEPDPHVWHDVENVVAMVELIRSRLLQLNPSQAEIYLQNSNTLTEKLWQLDAWIEEQIATIPEENRVLVTTHNSLHYYVNAYPIDEYKTLQGLSSDSSPTASQVKNLATEIEQTGVPTIFVEATSSDRVMNNVARAAGVKLSSDKLMADGLGEADNYIEMMSSNTCVIVDGLEGNCQTFNGK